jgi:putative ATPase
LIGATTENPSFELNSALLSRARVYIFNQLEPEDMREVIDKVLRSVKGGMALSEEAVGYLVAMANGDARSLITSLEILSSEGKKELSKEDAEQILQRKMLIYDKSGEEHFNLISALHKSIRNSDVQASIYWLARMLEGGEDPLYLARRLVRFASEDIGNAEPQALHLAIAAKETVDFLGMPECSNALTQLVIFMASAPKSNSVYRAYGAAREAVYKTELEPVPLHLRNAPTKLMKEVGYGDGYKYAHDYDAGVTNMSCLPERIANAEFYRPIERGFEREIKRRLDYWAKERGKR